MTDALFSVYLSLLIILSLIAAIRYRRIDPATRAISWFIWLGLATELIGRYYASKYRNNLPVYNVSCMAEWVLISLYFYYATPSFRKKRRGCYIALAGVLIGILNLLTLQPILKISSNFMFLECVGICCMSLFSIYKLLEIDDDSLQLHRKTHFWIPFILLCYQMGALWSWITYDYYERTDKSTTGLLQVLLLLNCIITYSGLIVVFLFYPKMKRIYV